MNMGLLLKEIGNQVTKDGEVSKLLFSFFYWQGLFSGLPGQLVQKQSFEKEKIPTTVGKDQVRFKFLEPCSIVSDFSDYLLFESNCFKIYILNNNYTFFSKLENTHIDYSSTIYSKVCFQPMLYK